jgi:hypothetical protein
MRHSPKYLLLLLSMVLILATFGFSGVSARAVAVHHPDGYTNQSWYLICEMDETGYVSVHSQMQVQLAAPLTNFSDEMIAEALARPNRNDQPVIVRLTDASGKVVFQKTERVSGLIRSEFGGENPDDPIQGHFVERDKTVFVVRVPVIKGTTMSLKKSDKDVVTEINLESMAREVPAIQQEKVGQLTKLGTHGNPANRVDILFMGDGYTQAQQSLYQSNINHIHDGFFNITPLGEYENYYNVNVLFTPSNESGTDYPTYNPSCPGSDNPNCCRDGEMANNPKNGTFVDTFYDGRYCGYHTFRLVMVNATTTFAQAGIHYPDWDSIFMILNDNGYGGSGGDRLATMTFDSNVVSVAQHEFGHSFGDLADEYPGYFNYPSCSDKTNDPPCEANVTDENTRAKIKWNPWILPSTPIPTNPGGYGPDFVGLFEGARYRPTGMYRPGEDCLMKYLHRPFCAVPSQAMVLRLYEGGWGEPETGLRQIEPGTTLPEETVIELTHPANLTFSFELLQPVGGPASSVQWYDGMSPIPGANGTSFTFETKEDEPGEHLIRVVVKDTTDLVHPEMAGNALISMHSWTVKVKVSPQPTPTPEPTPTQPPVVEYRLYLPVIWTKE